MSLPTIKRHRQLSPTSSLPQVPSFQVDSPLPPATNSTGRTWELTTKDLDMPPPPSPGGSHAADYGSDGEEDEIKALSVEELRMRCLSLMRAARLSGLPQPSPRHPPQTLSPAMYSVHSRNQGIRRLQLGRTSSIATRDELSKLPSEHPTEDDLVLRLLGALRQKGSEYTSSSQFADDIVRICGRVSAILERESRVLELRSPVYVFGDTHGNVDDLKFFADNVWPLGMSLTAGGFLFLGDYVDRGSGGLEVIAYLFAQKVVVPHKLFLLRGNHETRSVNGWEEYYGNASFLAQCKNRFGSEQGSLVWEECNRVFDRLPLAAIIDRTIFCVHGGIPRPPRDPHAKDTRLDDIRRIPCPIEVRQPMQGVEDANRLAFSLLWSDPADPHQEPYLEEDTGFGASIRGSGSVVFGTRAVEQFLKRFGLGYIMRAHEATASGVAVSKSAKVLTVFSTSKDHGCGGDAKCGCVLVDTRRIVAIIRSPEYQAGGTSSPTQLSDLVRSSSFNSHAMVSNYRRGRSISQQSSSPPPAEGAVGGSSEAASDEDDDNNAEELTADTS
jgi:diadenosine tetraphosphatase ApaH/serine/threonine PP2A family protein phosphatase